MNSLINAWNRIGLSLLFFTSGLVGAVACADETNAEQVDRPNVVIFLADDQGWGDLSVHGNRNLSTPNIDSLARDGALFERFFVCPVCAPTRAEFLTGRYYPRTGVRGVSTGLERLNPDEETIAEVFKRAGYATGAFGKWHNGSQHPYHPNARGFDEYYGFTSGHWGHYFDPVLERNNELTRGTGYITDDLTNKAMGFMEQKHDSGTPFLCYLPYNTPHSPMQVPDRFFEPVADRAISMHNRDPEREEPAHLRAALAMCENIDWNVGRVLSKLDELDLAEETIVIYFSDNGPNGWRWNGGMKGKKGSIDEGGVRVPMLIRWSGQIPANTRIKPIAGAIDLLPTLAALCGIDFEPKKPLDGKSLAPLLLDRSAEWDDRYLLSFRVRWGRRDGREQPRVSVRSQRYRLDDQGKLFDMVADPGQTSDVSAAHPDLVKRMKDAADKTVNELEEKLEPDERPFPVGHASNTMLPARDGEAHGLVQRSNRAPNCSYFTNWTGSPGDEITWDVEIAQPGPYEVTIHYACPKPDIGSSFEVTFNGARLESKVEVAHDPPLYGAETDRTADRGGESYVKDFKPMRAGSIDLPAGRGMLTLQAIEVPGDEVMEVRLLELRRVRSD